MQKNLLGNTGLLVTELCFGALPMGPLQANLSVEKGAEIIRTAVGKGINFIDTAELYQTYQQIRMALDGFGGEVIIATKSTAETYAEMEKSVIKALKELNREHIDIFHLHAAKAKADVFDQRSGALKCLLDYKEKGVIKAVGISAHAVEVIDKAADRDDIDVVFPIINKIGMGIIGGSAEDMLKAISKVHRSGKGLYAMKALAGGHLIDRLQEAYDYVRAIPGIASVAVGMVSEKELDINLRIFNGEKISKDELPQKASSNKKLIITFMCKGCGTCVEVCPNSALRLEDGKAVVNKESCLLCGYCNPSCPEFAIRLA